MRIGDALQLSTRMFRTRPMRTFLTIMGVGVGIGTVLFLVSLGYGLQRTVLNSITNTDSLLSIDVTPQSSGLVKLDQATINSMRGFPNVELVSPVANASAQMTIDAVTGDGLLYGVEPIFFRLSGLETMTGRILDEKGEREAVVSSAFAQLFDSTPEDLIGREVNVVFFLNQVDESGNERLKVVDIEKPFTIVGVVQDDTSSLIYVPLIAIQEANITEYVQAKVKVSSDVFMAGVRDKIIEMGFIVSALVDTIDQANKIFRIFQIILGLFGFVALIVSAIGMFNTMTVTLLERINEIGIMQAVGVTKRDIRILFLVEAMVMGFLGGLGGVLLGFIGGEAANFFINILAKNFGGRQLDIFYTPFWFVAIVIGFSTVIGFLTGVFPSRRAAKINPLEALRYK